MGMGNYCQNYGQRMGEKKSTGFPHFGLLYSDGYCYDYSHGYGLVVIGSRNSPLLACLNEYTCCLKKHTKRACWVGVLFFFWIRILGAGCRMPDTRRIFLDGFYNYMSLYISLHRFHGGSDTLGHDGRNLKILSVQGIT